MSPFTRPRKGFFFALLLLFAVFNGIAQSYAPIVVSGFNHDLIAEVHPGGPLAATSSEMDAINPSNFVLFSKGYAKTKMMSTGNGLPDNGRIVKGNRVYQLRKYSEMNALYLKKGLDGTLTFAPSKYSIISILGLATEGEATLQITLSFVDGTTAKVTGRFPDWFNGPSPVVQGMGRVKREDVAAPYYEGAPANPRMYAIDVQVPEDRVLRSITFRNVSSDPNGQSNRAIIFAVSGYLKPEPVSPAVQNSTKTNKPEDSARFVVQTKPKPVPQKKKPVETKPEGEEKKVVTSTTPQPVVEQHETTEPIKQPKPTIALLGMVRDKKSNEPLSATLHLEYGRESIDLRTIEGKYMLLPVEKNLYKITVSSPGYAEVTKTLDLTLATGNTELSFTLQPIEVGSRVVLNRILFKQSTATLLEGSYHDLDSISDFLLKNQSVRIEVAGHTDSYGSKRANLQLSNERAEAIKKYFVDRGVVADRITSKGFGGSMPIAPNNTEDSRKLNRRVEFTILSK
jgi:outer membrane protein OmpA-like peptidoglycan-associated protein